MRRKPIPLVDLMDLTSEVARNSGAMTFECDVWGSSMTPVINHGDRITVAVVSFDQLKQGDIVVYRDSDKQGVVHRLVKKNTAGDQMQALIRAQDERSEIEIVPADQILGKVIQINSPRIWVRLVRKVVRRLRRVKKNEKSREFGR